MSVKHTLGATALALAGLAAASQALAAANIIIVNQNGAGVGFNDPTPAEPVGGNTGTTVGQQRLIAFQRAADIWGATLTSSATIRIGAQFTNLSCSETTAVLGSAAPASSSINFTNAPFTNTWYPIALRNKLVGSELNANPQITTNFNARLGEPNCLPGSPWYYGLDNAPPAGAVNLVAVLLHEFAHGLGFTVGPTNGQSGARSTSAPSGSPSVWERFMTDNQTGQTWFQMTTNAMRAASATGLNRLVWNGANVTSEVPNVLRLGTPGATITGPAAGALANVTLAVGEASFGAPIGATPLFGEVMPVVDQADGITGLACEPLSPINQLAVRGKVALVDRGVCNFTVKAKNVQDAGATGVLIADNAAGSVPPGLGGSDPDVTITAVRIVQSDGVLLKSALKKRSRTASGVLVTLGVSGSQYSGADPLGRAKLYTPSPFESGSSVSHFDTTMFRNQLMEPSVSGDLTQSVIPPEDLTFMLFKDIGW